MEHRIVNKTYLILAHKNPEQLKRLIDRLDDSCSKFLIHIDLKSDITPFVDLIKTANVQFIVNRVNCVWGDYSQVAATLNLIEIALQTSSEGHVILLSGQDYPIKNSLFINDFLYTNKDHDFIITRPVENNTHTYERVKKYKFNLSDKRGDYILLPPIVGLSVKDIKAITRLLLKRTKFF
ncbi:beta-1,6-N-acetylglucosaminyltransferase [Formosa sp. A9]|uniref:beta-1,6-N-acetylglucosaminyltransferase n=1 Tax=Formosa sp. A9 TaxID=3442641 RepID=UPI003EB751EA